MGTTYNDSYTGNGPYTTEEERNPFAQFRQWQAGQQYETNARLTPASVAGNYGLEARRPTEQQRTLPTPQAPAPAAPAAGLPAPSNDIKGAAARINPTPRPYVANTNTYDRDRPAEMAQQLATESRSRFGGDAMSQLQNIMALRQIGDGPSMGSIIGDMGGGKTQTDLDNDEKTARWGREEMLRMAKNDPQLQSTINQLIQSESAGGINANNTAQRREEAMLRLLGQREQTQATGQNQLATEGLRGQNQLTAAEMQMRSNMGLEDRRDRRAVDMEALRGQNAQGLERLKWQNPENAGRDKYYDAQASYITNKDAREADEAKLGKTPMKQAQEKLKWLLDAYEKTGDPLYKEEATALYARMNVAKFREGGLVQGYAEGGAVDPHEADMRRRYEMAGLQYPGAPKQQPQQPAQPLQQPAQQQRQETWAEKARRAATGGLDQRMKGYAEGGAVDPYWSDKQSGITRGTDAKTGLPSITDPNAPGGANYNKGNTGLASSGGYGTYQGSKGGPQSSPGGGLGIPQNMPSVAGGQNSWNAPRDQGYAGMQERNAAPTTAYGGLSALAGGTMDEADYARGFANGGGVDVSGRQVFGVGGAASTGPKSDTVPAMIDGTEPAALDSGEFVSTTAATQRFRALLEMLNEIVAGGDEEEYARIVPILDAINAMAAGDDDEAEEDEVEGEGKGLDTGRDSA